MNINENNSIFTKHNKLELVPKPDLIMIKKIRELMNDLTIPDIDNIGYFDWDLNEKGELYIQNNTFEMNSHKNYEALCIIHEKIFDQFGIKVSGCVQFIDTILDRENRVKKYALSLIICHNDEFYYKKIDTVIEDLYKDLIGDKKIFSKYW